MNELILGIFSIVSILLIFFAFLTGLHYGSKIKNDEPIKKPTLNPVKIVKDKIETTKEEKKAEKDLLIETINLENIENYDGTGIGQKDIPS